FESNSGSAVKLNCADVTRNHTIVLSIYRSGKAPLIGRKQGSRLIPTAAGITAVDCPAAGQKVMRLRRTAVILQRTEHWIGDCPTTAVDRAALGSHQIVTT